MICKVPLMSQTVEKLMIKHINFYVRISVTNWYGVRMWVYTYQGIQKKSWLGL